MPAAEILKSTLRSVTLKQTRLRRPDIVDKVHAIVPDFIKKHSSASLGERILGSKSTDTFITHHQRTGREIYRLTGDERLALLGFFQDYVSRENFHFELADQLADSGIEIRENRLIIRMLNSAGCTRLMKLTDLDRKPRSDHINERFPHYERLMHGLWGEDIVRAVVLSDLVKYNLNELERIYEKSKKAGQNMDANMLQNYAGPIACVYLPLLERTKDHFELFDHASGYLAQAIALAVDMKWFHRIRKLMVSETEWASSLRNIEQLIKRVFSAQNPEIAGLRAMLSGPGELKVNIKRVHMAAIKAATEKRMDIGWEFDAEKFRSAMKDLVRVGGDVKDDVNPAEFLLKIIEILKRHGFNVKKEPFESNRNDVRSEGSLWFAVLESPGFLSEDGRPFQVELRTRKESDRIRFEEGDLNHEAMIVSRLAGFLEMPGGAKQIISPEILIRAQAKALVYGHLHDKGIHERGELSTATVEVVENVGQETYQTTFYKGACVADLIAPFLDITSEFEASAGWVSGTKQVSLFDKVPDDAYLLVGTGMGHREKLDEAKARDLLMHVTTQEAQFQLAALLQQFAVAGRE